MDESQRRFYGAFGAKLKARRRAMGLKQEGVGTAVGLSRTSITNIEKGRQPVQLHLARKLAELLHVDLQDLLPTMQPVSPPAINLAGIEAKKREWVERIMANPSFTSGVQENASTVQPRKEESRRTTESDKRRRATRTR